MAMKKPVSYTSLECSQLVFVTFFFVLFWLLGLVVVLVFLAATLFVVSSPVLVSIFAMLMIYQIAGVNDWLFIIYVAIAIGVSGGSLIVTLKELAKRTRRSVGEILKLCL